MTDAGEDAEKGAPSHTVVRMQASTTTLENSMEVPQNVENRTAL